MRECENCQSSLAGADLTLPWEGGDNPNAYVICRSCGHENTVYGFGAASHIIAQVTRWQ